jgi:CheY-like chemotaxis protein
MRRNYEMGAMIDLLNNLDWKEMGGVLSALANLAWPLLVLFLIIKFSKPTYNILDSIVKREVRIKLPNNTEVTLKQFAEQQIRTTEDLREQLVSLREIPSAKGKSSHVAYEFVSAKKGTGKITKILWVDDYPTNNALIISYLSDLGVDVETAVSTREGLRKLSSRDFDVVISDMGRFEEGKGNPYAGVDLATAVRQQDPHIPFFIYCSRKAKERGEKDALSAGANGVTASEVQFIRMISSVGTLEKLGQ